MEESLPTATAEQTRSKEGVYTDPNLEEECRGNRPARKRQCGPDRVNYFDAGRGSYNGNDDDEDDYDDDDVMVISERTHLHEVFGLHATLKS